jgi:hypothetical protein
MLDAELRDAETRLVLASVLDDIERLLTRYVVFRSPAQVCAVALWVVHTHTLRAVDVTPYLHVRSAEKGAGKTRLLEVLHELVPRPWHAVQPTEAVLFRRIHRDTPTLLLDETDAVFSKNGSTERAEAVRSVLNAGYRRGATVDRVNLRAKDPLQPYRVFCAKAFAGIGTLPGTVADRSIPIELARRKKTEPVDRFFLREAAPELHPVSKAIAAWGEDAVDVLRDARPSLPEALADRAAEVWEPLLAIADLAGGEWPARARKAALELHQGRTDTDSAGVALLRAIRDVFYPPPPAPDAPAPEPVNEVSTIDLLRALVDREGEPWAGWWGRDVDQAGEGNTPRKPAMELARHLKPFGIQPGKLRDGDKTFNGYKRCDFEDAFGRYLPPNHRPGGRNNGTSQGAQGFAAFRPAPADFEVGTAEPVVAQGLCRRSDLDLSGRTEKTDNGARPTVFDLAGAAAFPSLEIRRGVRVQGGREPWVKFLATATPDDVEAARRALERGSGIS